MMAQRAHTSRASVNAATRIIQQGTGCTERRPGLLLAPHTCAAPEQAGGLRRRRLLVVLGLGGGEEVLREPLGGHGGVAQRPPRARLVQLHQQPLLPLRPPPTPFMACYRIRGVERLSKLNEQHFDPFFRRDLSPQCAHSGSPRHSLPFDVHLNMCSLNPFSPSSAFAYSCLSRTLKLGL